MAGNRGDRTTGEMQRRVGLYLLLLLQPILMVSSARQLQDLHVSQGRTLKQVANAHSNLLTDYIGASGGDIQFTDVPLASGVSYIFLLSFAIDADATGNTQNGNFAPFWSSSLTPAAAQSFVQQNSNVRLVASLAGFSQFIPSTGETRTVDWYDPPSTDDWIANAVSSISDLVSQYSLSGIDIDYENFPESSTFTTCIGGLITQLKNNNVISVASIAPFGNTLSVYQDLFQNFGTVIDYVNYQFYAGTINSQSDFVTDFNNVAGKFDSTKLLASVEVGANGASGRGLQGNDFISAAQQVSIAGIMIFDADNSKSNGFQIENLSTAYLTS